MPPTRVLVLHNEPVLSADHPDAISEHEILYTVETVSKALLQAGFEVTRLGVSYDADLLVNGLRDLWPDVVFNLFEGTAEHGHCEASVAGVLEWLRLPYTGCPFQTLLLARNKPLTKYLFQGAGLPTPDFFVVEDLPVPPCPIEWPVIVKPATQDASIGVDQGSVVTDQEHLCERVEHVLQTYGGPVLVEQFINGREITLGLIENPELTVLPPAEITFPHEDPSFWPIVTYDAKWKPGTRDYDLTPPIVPKDLSPRLSKRLGTLARQAFRLLGCRDYARVDFRVKPSGKPYLLEVNPNPCFSPVAGLATVLPEIGWTHAQFMVELVKNALNRATRPVAERNNRKSVTPLVREGRAADRDAVCQAIDSWNGFPEEEAAFAKQMFNAAVEDPAKAPCHALVVEQENQVLGCALYTRAARTDETFYLHWMGVASDCQGQGLGWKLMQAVEAKVVTAEGKVLVAETSSQPAHAPARRFFLRQGFRLAGDLPDFYREGEGRLTYAKYLSSDRPE